MKWKEEEVKINEKNEKKKMNNNWKKVRHNITGELCAHKG